MTEQIERRVNKIEESHIQLSQSFRDYVNDFKHLAATMDDVRDVLKSMAKTERDFLIFTQKFDAHCKLEELELKEMKNDITDIKKNHSKVVWMVLSPVILAILGLVIKKAVG